MWDFVLNTTYDLKLKRNAKASPCHLTAQIDNFLARKGCIVSLCVCVCFTAGNSF